MSTVPCASAQLNAYLTVLFWVSTSGGGNPDGEEQDTWYWQKTCGELFVSKQNTSGAWDKGGSTNSAIATLSESRIVNRHRCSGSGIILRRWVYIFFCFVHQEGSGIAHLEDCTSKLVVPFFSSNGSCHNANNGMLGVKKDSKTNNEEHKQTHFLHRWEASGLFCCL